MSKGDRNILHCLVHTSQVGGKQAEQQALRVYEWLCEQLPIEVIRELLFAEDRDGLRPLELAAYLGTFHLADRIMHTEGVYKTTIRRGLYQDDYFDITDYEITSGLAARSDRSPLSLHIASPFSCSHDTLSLLQTDPMKAWERAKVKCNVLFIVLWFLARILIVALFIVIDLDIQGAIAAKSSSPNEEISNKTEVGSVFTSIICPKARLGIGKATCITLISLLIMFSFLTVLKVLIYIVYGILKYVSQNYFKERTKLWKSPICLDAFDCFQFCSAIGTIAYMVFALLFYIRHYTGDIGMQVMVIVNMPLFFLEIFYFAIFLERVGHFAAIIHQMIRDLIIFLLVFCGFIFTQAYVLQRIVARCQSGISGFFYYFYYCFRILISSDDPDYFPNISGLHEVWNMVYIIFGSIMLFNFLIALFTETFSKVISARENILSTARLGAIYKIEALLADFIPAWYKFNHRKVFVCYKGKVFLKLTRYQGGIQDFGKGGSA